MKKLNLSKKVTPTKKVKLTNKKTGKTLILTPKKKTPKFKRTRKYFA